MNLADEIAATVDCQKSTAQLIVKQMRTDPISAVDKLRRIGLAISTTEQHLIMSGSAAEGRKALRDAIARKVAGMGAATKRST